MVNEVVQLGEVGKRDTWDIDVELSLVRDIETWEPMWIRPAPMSKLPGDGWNDLAQCEMGDLLYIDGLEKETTFDGWPVYTIKEVTRCERNRMTFTTGKAPSIFTQKKCYWKGRRTDNPTYIKRLLNQHPEPPVESYWHINTFAGENFYVQVTVFPGEDKLCNRTGTSLSFPRVFNDGLERSWQEMLKGSFGYNPFRYQNMICEDGVMLDEDTRETIGEGEFALTPKHIIVHNSALVPYYFVIGLSMEAYHEEKYLEKFTDGKDIAVIDASPTPR